MYTYIYIYIHLFIYNEVLQDVAPRIYRLEPLRIAGPRQGLATKDASANMYIYIYIYIFVSAQTPPRHPRMPSPPKTWKGG